MGIPIIIKNTDKKGNILFWVQLLLMLPGIGLMMLILFSSNWLLADVHTPLEILKGYHTWYAMLFFGGIAITAVILTIQIIILVKLKQSFAPQHIYALIISLLLTCIFTLVMVFMEKVPSLMQDASADIKAIENSKLVTETGMLSARRYDAKLPGPHSESEPLPLTRMTLYIQDKGVRNIFVADTSGIGKITGEWSDELYNVTYTPNLFVVVEYTPTE